MITYIDAKNAAKYQVLFDKAAALLKEKQPSALTSTLEQYNLTWDDFAIGSLNEYFAYLQDLISAADSEDEKKFFVRLPLDEGVFAINADSRSISIPTSFARNGVGVTGDEMAEIVYFTIDRYFDSIDLANKDISIAIQWSAKNAQKEIISGISKNFGKDIESIPGKIIFGWPISHELTETAGTIKFAVRFYTIEDIDNQGNRAFTYSFTTLPAEISVQESLNYDLINGSVKEVDYGQVITGRIRNSGIYDPSIPIPGEPEVTTDLYVLSPEGNEGRKIVDLPIDGSGVDLAISAKPSDIGVVGYNWKKFGYDTEQGDYNASADRLTSGTKVDYVEETADIAISTAQQYYKRTGTDNTNYVYTLIELADYESEAGICEYVEGRGFLKADSINSYDQLFKKMGLATVNTVGVYVADVTARALVNTTTVEMDFADGIKIPGPLTPVIELPEPEVNVSITEADRKTHVIAAAGSATLKANAVIGEAGKSAAEVGEDPVVSLAYAWKQRVNGVDIDVTGETVETCPVQLDILPALNVPGDENEDDAAYNQDKVSLVQVGANAVIYASGALRTYESTDENQGEGKWIAIDIDTGLDSIIGATWGGVYEFTQVDVDEAASVGLGAGHVIFWAKAENLAAGSAISINDTTINISFSDSLPDNVTYTFNEDKSQMTITGLSEGILDNTYFVEVTATRNGISTTGVSGDYRITNAPEAPDIKIRSYNGSNWVLTSRNYRSENNTIQVNTRQLKTLSFSLVPPTQSDSISYIWMRLRADEKEIIPSDWDEAAEKLQVDLDDAIAGLSAIVGNPTGEADYPVESNTIATARKYLATIDSIGDPADEGFENNGPKYELQDADPTGIYYCVVINELNNNINANVSPFYRVS